MTRLNSNCIVGIHGGILGGMTPAVENRLKLAQIASELGDIDRAGEFFSQALTEAEKSGHEDIGALASVLYEAQRFYAKVGDHERAKVMAHRFRRIALNYFENQSDEVAH